MSVLEKFKEQIVDKLPPIDSYERHDGLKCVIIDDRGLKDTERAMKSVKAILPDANIVHYRDPINSIEDYDLLLTSEGFWNRHLLKDNILIFQPDSLILNGFEFNRGFHFEYMGAPWDLSRAEKYGSWVGNGGLSYRDVYQSLIYIKDYPFEPKYYHHEDTYFSYWMKTAPLEIATKFSVEWHYYPKPFGIHDIETHLSQKLTENILKNSDLNRLI